MGPEPLPREDARAELSALAHALRGAVRRRRRAGARNELVARAAEPAAASAPLPGATAASSGFRPVALTAPSAQAPVPATAARSAAQRESAPAPAASTPAPRGAPELAGPRPAELAPTAPDLEQLRQLVAACTACELCSTRRNTVFSDGPPRARLLFVGEAPGESEDEQGVPFVGRAGALLTDIIVKGMGLARSEVAIANVLKCRPPGNRDPSPEEKQMCSPFLDRQIELIDPQLIVALGRHAAQHLLAVDASMGALRGRVHVRGARKVVATYHPAYLLRNPAAKKDCWQDIQLALSELGLPLPTRAPRP
jgi:uracil-DNA glycosylase family 4